MKIFIFSNLQAFDRHLCRLPRTARSLKNIYLSCLGSTSIGESLKFHRIFINQLQTAWFGQLIDYCILFNMHGVTTPVISQIFIYPFSVNNFSSVRSILVQVAGLRLLLLLLINDFEGIVFEGI